VDCAAICTVQRYIHWYLPSNLLWEIHGQMREQNNWKKNRTTKPNLPPPSFNPSTPLLHALIPAYTIQSQTQTTSTWALYVIPQYCTVPYIGQILALISGHREASDRVFRDEVSQVLISSGIGHPEDGERISIEW